ncbi:hypothetical protein WT13_32075 [Burkholderia anthina]|nr:hypothetical protein WT13_32075 [Burkholderia anthina]
MLGQILSGSEIRRVYWRELLLKVLDGQSGVLSDVLPELEALLGPQPSLSIPDPQDAQRRFHRVFLRLIGAFARRDHPLILFLDDLQWFDVASLQLLSSILDESTIGHFLLVGAYRDNEVTDDHPLAKVLASVHRDGVPIKTLVLRPLAVEAVRQIVSQTLAIDDDRVDALATLIEERTGGNPFFAIQFFHAVVDEGLVQFDRVSRVWKLNLEVIRGKAMTDNVVALMSSQLNRLPRAARVALASLACIGSSARTERLARLYGCSTDCVHARLSPAVEAGLVIQNENGFSFVHDRVQETAYNLLNDHERADEHLRIARILSCGDDEERDAKAQFEIVDHYRRALHLVASKMERRHVARACLRAGTLARRQAAYASALSYFRSGTELLEAECWLDDRAFSFDLHLFRAECEFLNGNLSYAEEALDALTTRAQSDIERARLTWLRITVHTAMGRTDRAVDICLEFVRRAGIDWTGHPGRDAARHEYQRLLSRIGDKPIASLADLQVLADEDCRHTLEVLTAVLPPAFFSDENLVCLVLCRMANLSIDHGNSDASPLAYAYLGMVLGPLFGDYVSGYQFGRLAIDLVDRKGLDRFKARIYMCFAYHVIPWTRHIDSERPMLMRAFDLASGIGDLTYTGFSSCTLVTSMLASGDPLDEVSRLAEERLGLMRRAQFGLVADIITAQFRLVSALRGLTDHLSTFDGADFDDGTFASRLSADPCLDIAQCWYWIRKSQLYCFAGEFAAAHSAAQRAEPLLWTSSGHFEEAEYYFYAAVAACGLHDRTDFSRRTELRQLIGRYYARLSLWAEHCPENFSARAHLIAAEMARIEGKEIDAMRLYEKAAHAARESRFTYAEALVNERAANFYADRGFAISARAHLVAARYAYLRWGALAKVSQLDQAWADLASDADGVQSHHPIETDRIDLASIMTTSQAISSEGTLERLINTLMTLVLEHAGAQRGVLVKPKNEGLFIEAEATVVGQSIEVRMSSEPVDDCRLPKAMLHQVLRRSEHMLLHDAGQPDAFEIDGYFAKHRVRSVLCLPLMKQTRLVGLLYLENNLAPSVFTDNRLAILRLIASQAAIALENAVLQEKQNLLDEKDVLLKEVHHRVKNNLQLISSLLSLQARQSDDPILSKVLTDSRNRVRSMALVHENLYRAGNFARVSMRDHIGNLCAHLRTAFGLRAASIMLNERLEDIQLDLNRAVSCGLIVNELVTNALKHAFPDGRHGSIDVELRLINGGYCELSVSDDGIGIPSEFDLTQAKSMGLQLVHDLTAQLAGACRVCTASGAHFVITFPGNMPAARQ